MAKKPSRRANPRKASTAASPRSVKAPTPPRSAPVVATKIDDTPRVRPGALRPAAASTPTIRTARTAKTTLPAEAALSFLRDTKSTLTWSPRDLAQTLHLAKAETQQALALLQAQGYIQPDESDGEWITTPSGETVSGAKPPRFDRESVERALAAFQQRIRESNQDRNAPFKIDTAVAFGDFLLKDRARVQAADVGIQLSRSEGDSNALHSAAEARQERDFLRGLRGRTVHVQLRSFAPWMKMRTHRDLL
jgi:hypothetical protein